MRKKKIEVGQLWIAQRADDPVNHFWRFLIVAAFETELSVDGQIHPKERWFVAVKSGVDLNGVHCHVFDEAGRERDHADASFTLARRSAVKEPGRWLSELTHSNGLPLVWGKKIEMECRFVEGVAPTETTEENPT